MLCIIYDMNKKKENNALLSSRIVRQSHKSAFPLPEQLISHVLYGLSVFIYQQIAGTLWYNNNITHANITLFLAFWLYRNQRLIHIMSLFGSINRFNVVIMPPRWIASIFQGHWYTIFYILSAIQYMMQCMLYNILM